MFFITKFESFSQPVRIHFREDRIKEEAKLNKNRYLLCLLLCGLMLYYAAPRMGVFNGGTEGIFAISWLALALFVIAGNLTALLYAPKKAAVSGKRVRKLADRKRAHSLGR